MESEIISIVIFCIVFVFNVTGNSLVIYIICKKHRTSTDHLLLNLAVADLLFGVFVVIEQLSLFSLVFLPNSYYIVFQNGLFCHLVSSGNIAWFAFVDSILTMLVLSVERYFAVCRPYNFKKYFSTRNVKFMVILSWVSSVAIIAPRNIEQSCISPKDVTEKAVSVISAVLSIVTLIVLIVLSINIYVSLWCKHRAQFNQRKLKR